MWQKLLALLMDKVLGRLMACFGILWGDKKRRERLNPLVIEEGGVERLFSWRGRGDVHIIDNEEPPRQLRGFGTTLCKALREESGMEPQFNVPHRIRGEIVFELSADFKAKWRLLGGESQSNSRQVLVLVPR